MRRFKLSADSPALGASHVVPSLLDVCGEVVDVGLLSVREGGAIIAYNRRFAQLCALPQRGFERGTLAELVEWLVQQRDELSRAISSLLSSAVTSSAVTSSAVSSSAVSSSAVTSSAVSSSAVTSNGEITSSDGRALEWRRVAVSDEQGHTWAFRDVSETRQMAAALLDAASWLRMLEVHTEGVLLELDAEAQIVGLWGPSRQFFNEPDAVLQGKTLVEAIPGAEGTALDARVRLALSSAIRQDYECCIEVGGAQRVLSTSAMPMPSSKPAAARVTLMIRDVTERAHMQAKLLQVERLASVGLLAAGVAHEINNPLAYVLLNLERVRAGLGLLGDGRHAALLAELATAIEMSIEGASRVRTIVGDLKRFSHPDDNLQLPADVHRSIDFAIAMAEPALQGRAKLTRDYGALPAVCASEARLSQIFLNLIINAAHCLPEAGRARREIRVVTRTHPGGEALIEIHDTGLGISGAALRQVFEPFYTTKPPGMGTGLGLTICQDIARTLGGRIEVESAVGRGSVFRVALPASLAS
jgi:two-component system NtrC family sensor kinase